MIDTEKVIKGLKCCMTTDVDTCPDCPYNNENDEYGENICLRKKLIPDTLALLKEKEREKAIEEALKRTPIEGLEWILEDDRFGFGINWSENDLPRCEEEWAGYYIQRAIAMLKKQEAKPMTEYDDGWDCPRCGLKLFGKTASGYPYNELDLPSDEIVKYCPECGQAVKWE